MKIYEGQTWMDWMTCTLHVPVTLHVFLSNKPSYPRNYYTNNLFEIMDWPSGKDFKNLNLEVIKWFRHGEKHEMPKKSLNHS